MAKSNLSNEERVSEYISKLEISLAETITYLSEIILEIDVAIASHIKWNSVSFYYSGEMKPFDPKEYKRDVLVLNIHRKEQILIVFPTGNKINDTSGILEGNYTDGRKLLKIKDLKDAKWKKNALQNAIRDWISKIEK
jgi:hypothetical protein